MEKEIIVESTILRTGLINGNEQIFYENQVKYIKLLIKGFSEFINLERLDKIFITEDYRSEVIAYQELLGYRGYSTNNQFSKAIGQMLKDERDPLNIKYVVFLSKDIAYLLFQEDFVNYLPEMSKSKKEEILSFRIKSHKLLLHELVHIHESELILEKRITLLEKTSNNVFEIFNSFAYVLWQEYYATRIPAIIFPTYQNDVEEILNLWSKYERIFVKNRYLYNLRKIDFDDMFMKMGENSRTILIELMYYLGELYSLEDIDRMNQLTKDIDFLNNLKLTSLIQAFYNELDDLFDRFENWKDFNELNNLSLLVQEYFAQFDIIFSDTSVGLKVDIDFNSELYDLYADLENEY